MSIPIDARKDGRWASDMGGNEGLEEGVRECVGGRELARRGCRLEIAIRVDLPRRVLADFVTGAKRYGTGGSTPGVTGPRFCKPCRPAWRNATLAL